MPVRFDRHRELPFSSEPALIAAALVVVYIILGILYESFIHPLTILSTLPSAGVGALLALQFGHIPNGYASLRRVRRCVAGCPK